MICAAAVGLIPLVALHAAEGSPARPNVVLLFIDDMGYGDIGPFGSTKNRTPNLDRMAPEGMKLTSFYAAPVCTASRAQMMTGCYAKRVSMPDVIFPAQPTGISTRRAHRRRVAEGRRATRRCASASGTSATSRSSCRRGTVSTITSACPTRTTWAAKAKPCNGRSPPLPLVRDGR